MGPNQTEKLLYNKGNHKTKRQPLEWEKICAKEVTDKGLIPQIYKQSYNSTTTEKQTDNPF